MSLVRTTRPALKEIKTVLSVDKEEARMRVFNLYKYCMKQMPYTVEDYDIPLTLREARKRVKEEFMKNKHVSDLRAIDILVAKGQMELIETANVWKQRGHVMNYFNVTDTQKMYAAKHADTQTQHANFLNRFYGNK